MSLASQTARFTQSAGVEAAPLIAAPSHPSCAPESCLTLSSSLLLLSAERLSAPACSVLPLHVEPLFTGLCPSHTSIFSTPLSFGLGLTFTISPNMLQSRRLDEDASRRERMRAQGIRTGSRRTGGDERETYDTVKSGAGLVARRKGVNVRVRVEVEGGGGVAEEAQMRRIRGPARMEVKEGRKT